MSGNSASRGEVQANEPAADRAPDLGAPNHDSRTDEAQVHGAGVEAVVEAYLEELQSRSPRTPDCVAADYPDLHDQLLPRLQLIARLFSAGQPEQNEDSETLSHGADVSQNLAEATRTFRSAESEPPPPRPSSASAPLAEFGDYCLLEKIGRGGMGLVYRAEQLSLKRVVAIKMLLAGSHAGEDEVARFLQEAEAAAALDHPAIVPVHEVGHHAGQYFFSMGYVAGRSLAQRIAEGPLAPRAAAELTRTVAGAIDYAHRQGVIHRDLKPGNILLNEQGQPRVTDFGLAKRVDASAELTATGQILGTPSYMPPEQASGRWKSVDARADVYALGAVLYACLVGRPPFHAATITDTLAQVLNDPPLAPSKLVPRLPRDLETICLKCLAKEPSERYPTAADLADDLQRYLDGLPVHARRVGSVGRVWRWCRRKPVVASLTGLAACLLMAIAIAGWFAFRAAHRESLAHLLADIEQRTGELTSDAETLSPIERLLEQLAQSDAAQAARLRQRLANRFAQAIDADLSLPKLSEQDYVRLQAAIGALQQRQFSTEELYSRLKQRRSDWEVQAELRGPYSELPDLLDAADFVLRDGHLLRAPASAAESEGSTPAAARVYRATKLRAQGDIEFEVAWGSQWETADRLGIELRPAGGALPAEEGYEIAITTLPLASRVAQSSQEPVPRRAQYQLEFYRKQNRLKEVSANLSRVEPASLNLRVRRENGRWAVQVADQPPIEIDELFPLSPAIPLQLRVVVPDGVALARVVARQRRNPTARSPLEEGDRLFQEGQYQEAFEQYELQVRTAVESRFRLESRFKQALSLSELQRPQEAETLLAPLLEAEPPWSVRAASQLWLSYLRQGRHQDADEMVGNLTSRFRFEELAASVPEDLRKQILSFYTSEWDVFGFRPNPDRIERLSRSVVVQRLLGGSHADYLDSRWALVVSYLRAGQEHEGEQLIETWLSEPDCEFYDRYLIVSAQAGLRLRRGDTAGALRIVNRWLLDEAGTIRRERAPLLIVRAAAQASVGNWDLAQSDLDVMATFADQDETLRHYFQRAECSLLRGFVAEALDGNLQRARQTWRAGWANARDLRSPQVISLAALSGQLHFADAQRALRMALAGGAGSPTALLFDRVASAELALIAMPLLNTGADTPRGRRVIRDLLLGQYPFDDQFHLPHQVAAYGFVRWLAVGRHGGHQVLEAEHDELFWQVTEELYQAYISGEFVEFNVVHLYNTFNGREGWLGWQSLQGSLKPRLRGLLAFVFGCHYLNHGNHAGGERLLRVALTDAPAESALHRYAERVLRLGMRATPVDATSSYLGGDLLAADLPWRWTVAADGDSRAWYDPQFSDEAWQSTRLPAQLSDLAGRPTVETPPPGTAEQSSPRRYLRFRARWEPTQKTSLGEALLEVLSPYPVRVYGNGRLVADWRGPRSEPAAAAPEQSWSPSLRGYADRGAFVVPADVWGAGPQTLAIEVDLPAAGSLPDSTLSLWVTARCGEVLSEMLSAPISTAQLRAARCLSRLDVDAFPEPGPASRQEDGMPFVTYKLGREGVEFQARGEAAALVHYATGLRHWGEGRPEDALAALSRALEVSPEHILARRDRGQLWLQLRRYSEAAEDLSVAARRLFDDAPLWLDLSDLHYRLQDYAGAGRAADNAGHLDPSGWRTKLALGRSRRTENKLDEAVTLLRQAHQAQPANGEVRYYLGEALAADPNAREECLEHLKAAVITLPDSTRARELLIVCCLAVRRVDEARQAVDEALLAFPNHAHFHRLASAVHKWANLPEQAVESVRQLLRLEPDAPENHYLLAERLRDAGQLEEAVAEFSLAVSAKWIDAWHDEMGKTLGELPEEHARRALFALPTPAMYEVAFNYAGQLVRERKLGAYRQLGAELIASLANVQSVPSDWGTGRACSLTARICSLDVAAAADKARVLALADLSRQYFGGEVWANHTYALALFRNGQLPEAAAILEPLSPGDLGPLNPWLLALIYKQQGKPEQATQSFEQGNAANSPALRHPHNEIARILLRRELEPHFGRPAGRSP